MNKNAALGLNVVLAIAVVILYIMHFSGGSGEVAETDVDVVDTTAQSSDTTGTPAVNFMDTAVKPNAVGPVNAARIAYINIDSINAGYQLITDLTKDLLAEQGKAQSRLKKKYQQLEARYVEMEKQSKYWTKDQMAQGQQELQKMQEEVQQFEGRLQQDLLTKEQEHQTILLRNVKAYLRNLALERGYDFVVTTSEMSISPVLYGNQAYNITGEVLYELNRQYAADMGN